jgi:hypothetical protein
MATDLLRALDDKRLFARFFRDSSTWAAWRVFLRALFALPIAGRDLDLYQRCTGRATPPSAAAREAYLICGRRAGKSFIAALVGTYLACFRDYRDSLSAGERAVVMILAVDRSQAGVIFRYVQAFLSGVPMLSKMVERETAEAIDLANGVTIEVRTASFRGVRGRTIVAAIVDEIAFLRSEDSANPDTELLAALRPGMATIPGALLLCLSSPYARRGVLFDAFQRHYGVESSPVLLWRAATTTMNPSISQELIDEAMASDPQAAAAEWMAEFRGDVSAFMEDAWITDAIDSGCRERGAADRYGYFAFIDPSGGKRDSFALGIAHSQGGVALLDLVREWKAPLDPATVVGEIAKLVRPYGIRSVTGDAYSGEWCQAAFREAGLQYAVSDRAASEVFLEVGPLFAQGKVRLVDHERLTMQLRQLERRTAASGRDRVGHPPGGHDDLAVSACGALRLAATKREGPRRDPRREISVESDYPLFSAGV